MGFQKLAYRLPECDRGGKKETWRAKPPTSPQASMALAETGRPMANHTYSRDKRGNCTEKVYHHSNGSKTHWKTYDNGTPRVGPFRETKSGAMYNKYGRQVGHTRKKDW